MSPDHLTITGWRVVILKEGWRRVQVSGSKPGIGPLGQLHEGQKMITIIENLNQAQSLETGPNNCLHSQPRRCPRKKKEAVQRLDQ